MSSSGFKAVAHGSGSVRAAGIPAAAPGGHAGAQPAAVSKGYSFASMWEQVMTTPDSTNPGSYPESHGPGIPLSVRLQNIRQHL